MSDTNQSFKGWRLYFSLVAGHFELVLDVQVMRAVKKIIFSSFSQMNYLELLMMLVQLECEDVISLSASLVNPFL